ncbi:MAG: NUDIX hydrolase [Rhodobacterales bacterium]|jgi:8-oxo-dGTP pyrophosphatase MutT (NUDIX family)
MTMDKTAIRNAATLIILRDRATSPRILMGQRGAKAAFMPNKFVFPGGAVDTEDAEITLANAIPTLCNQRLSQDCDGDLTTPLCIAAIRELWEETGLILGQKAQWQGPPSEAWHSFAARGYIPSAKHLTFVFRAITPPGRSRRFDARFFLVDAAHLIGDIDNFSAASDELSHLQWVPLHQTSEFDLPFITEVVLAEIVGNLGRPDAPVSVPFFKNDDESSEMLRLRGYELHQ